MAASARSELSPLRRFARRYLLYGTAVLGALLVLTEAAAPAVVAWFRRSPQELLWLRVPFALYAFVIGLWTRLHLWALLAPVVLALFRWVDVRASWRRGLWWGLAIGVPVAAVHVALEQGVFTWAAFTRQGVYPDFTTSFVRAEPYDVEDWPLAVFLFRRFVADYFTYFILGALCFAHEHFVRSREQEAQAQALRAELAQAQLQALRMQVNPHFLFNTLHTISTMAGRDPEGIQKATARLSDLLRYALSTSDQQEVPLDEELDVLDSYLEIQKLRLGDRLSVSVDVEPAARRALVPTLLLQPLAENAVKHGFEGRDETGHLRVQAAREDDRLVLRVADNGRGMSEEQLDALDADGATDEGLGLGTLAERLDGLYGDAAALTFETSDGGGLCVRIRLPFRVRAPDERLRASGVVAE